MSSGRNVKKKEYEKLEKYERWRRKYRYGKLTDESQISPIGTLGTMILKLEKWFQSIPGATSDIYLEKGTAS